MSNDCDLCRGDIITVRYFEDDECWIADCEICRVPMVVWRVHDPAPTVEVKSRLRKALGLVANNVLGEGNWSIDDHMRNIPDHYHAHARPPFLWRRAGA